MKGSCIWTPKEFSIQSVQPHKLECHCIVPTHLKRDSASVFSCAFKPAAMAGARHHVIPSAAQLAAFPSGAHLAE